MIPPRIPLPLALQIAAVIVLFAAALGTLWYASSSVVGREERRAWANDRLKQAGDLLTAAGKSAIDQVLPYPEYMGPHEWAAIDHRLAEASTLVRARFPGVEGGYYVPDRQEQPFLPAVSDTGRGVDPRDDQELGSQSPHRNLYDYIETQADAAYRKKYALLVIEDVPPDTVAIQATPIRARGRVVAAAWTMTRLVDPVFLDRPAAVYRLFAWLAIAGIAVSMALTFNLARTVRHHASERDRLELDLRRSERLAALGKLLAGVAHEVRNPLAGIRSTAQLWQRGLGIDDESLEGLVHEVDRLEEIVSSLLQFSRADAQNFAPGDVNTVLTEAARLATGLAESRGVHMDLDLSSGLPPVLMSAPALLQIFRNLTANAIQAMPDGGTIQLGSRFDPFTRVVLASVTDSGQGMSADTVSHLFEPFFTTKPEGTGLGLAIAREIALAHGGDLRAGNRHDGKGAVFTLTLPAASGLPDGVAQ